MLRRANLSPYRFSGALAAVLVVLNPYAAWGRSLLPTDPGKPVLWVGRMIDGRGNPVAGTVVAEIRPAPSAIPTRQQVEDAEARGLVPPSTPSIPLVSARAGRDGQFELRAAMPTGVPASYTPEGWVHILLSARSDDGLSAWPPIRFAGSRLVVGSRPGRGSPRSPVPRRSSSCSSRARARPGCVSGA